MIPVMSNRVSEDDLARLQGQWRQIGYERDGIVDPQDDEADWSPLSTFIGNRFVVTIADGSTPIAGTFRLDPTSQPKSIDWTDTHGADAGKTFLAIYTLEGDDFRFCAAMEGRPRPTRFATEEGQVLRTNVRIA